MIVFCTGTVNTHFDKQENFWENRQKLFINIPVIAHLKVCFGADIIWCMTQFQQEQVSFSIIKNYLKTYQLWWPYIDTSRGVGLLCRG